MPKSRPLTPEEKKQVASLRVLIGSEVLDEVRQGVELLLTLRDTEICAVFAEGYGSAQRSKSVFRHDRRKLQTYVAGLVGDGHESSEACSSRPSCARRTDSRFAATGRPTSTRCRSPASWPTTP